MRQNSMETIFRKYSLCCLLSINFKNCNFLNIVLTIPTRIFVPCELCHVPQTCFQLYIRPRWKFPQHIYASDPSPWCSNNSREPLHEISSLTPSFPFSTGFWQVQSSFPLQEERPIKKNISFERPIFIVWKFMAKLFKLTNNLSDNSFTFIEHEDDVVLRSMTRTNIVGMSWYQWHLIVKFMLRSMQQ